MEGEGQSATLLMRISYVQRGRRHGEVPLRLVSPNRGPSPMLTGRLSLRPLPSGPPEPSSIVRPHCSLFLVCFEIDDRFATETPFPFKIVNPKIQVSARAISA